MQVVQHPGLDRPVGDEHVPPGCLQRRTDGVPAAGVVVHDQGGQHRNVTVAGTAVQP